MDRGAWRATVHGVTKSQTQLKQLSTCTHINSIFWMNIIGLNYINVVKEVLCYFHLSNFKYLRNQNSIS